MLIGKTRWFVVLFFTHVLCQQTLLAITNGTPSVLLYSPSVTVTSLEVFAREDDGRAWISWKTTAELGVNAFRVVRYREGATPEHVGAGYVQANMAEEGSAYELADPSAKTGEKLRYELIMAASSGTEQPVAEWAGVINVRALPRMVQPSHGAEASLTQAPVALEKSWVGTEQQVRTWTDGLPADRVRLSLRDEGIYRVSAQELATASGWTEATVISALTSTNLNLSSQGNSIAWHTDGTNLFFYGIPPASRFAPENVYWLTLGPGSRMEILTGTPAEPVITNRFFVDHILRQGTNHLTRVSYNSNLNLPFVAFLPILVAGNQLLIQETLTDCATELWSGTVTVNLLSYYTMESSFMEAGTDIHHVNISMGDTSIGEHVWTNEQYVSINYPFSSTKLTNSAAILAISNIANNPGSSTDYTRFLCMSYGVSYSRLYQAHNEMLRCTGGSGNMVAVSGFASNDVKVLDVTMTNAPVVIEPITQTYDSMTSQWTAAFACGGSGQVYQVYSTSAGVRLPSVRGVRDIDWSSATNAAEYVILIPPEGWRDGFRQALQPLADYRNAQGLKTKIVDVEAIYNAFSAGLVDPHAIQTFCATLYPRGLKYLLLAGAGSIDFKQQALSVTSYTACLIPTLIAGQRFLESGEDMTVALDGALGDVNQDNIPEVAVGRLPTTQTNEVAIVVQKTIASESDRRWKQQASIVADWDNTGTQYYAFGTGTDRLIAPLGKNGRTVSKHYVPSSASGFDVFYNGLRPALQSGASLFHFFGHANELGLGGGSSRLLLNTDITNEAFSWQKPTIAVIIGCLPNRWHSPYTTTPLCILPYGLFAPNGGFVAGLGATGYMLGSEGEELAVNLYSGSGDVRGRRRLGDLWLHGLQHNRTAVNKMPPERLLCYSLIGDPTLMFDLDRRTLILFH